MPNRLLPRDEWPAAFAEQARVWREQWRAIHCENVHHCWHAPRDWQQGTSQIPVPRRCCWCGTSEGPQLDMLPGLKAEDSGDRTPRSCFSVRAHGVLRLVFAAKVPLSGTFTLAKATRKSPQVSYALHRLNVLYALE